MQHRFLGRSGLKVSEISYGNWITHGSQVEEDAAIACVNAALDVGITTFDTADVYAGDPRRGGAGPGAEGPAPRGPRDLHQGLLADRARRERPRPVAQAHQREHQRLAAPARHRLRRPLPGAPLRPRDPARGDAARVRRPRARRARCSTSASRSGTPRRSVARSRSPSRWASTASSPTSRSTPCSTASSRPRSCPRAQELGLGQIVWSPIAQGVLTGKYLPGQPPPEGSRATDPTSGHFTERLRTDEILTAVQGLKPLAEQAGLSMAQLAVAWVLQNDNVVLGDHRRQPSRAGHRERQGRRRRPRARPARRDRHRARRRRGHRPAPHRLAREAPLTWATGPGATSAPTARCSR